MKPIKPGIPNLVRTGTGRNLTAEEHALNANRWGLLVNFAEWWCHGWSVSHS